MKTLNIRIAFVAPLFALIVIAFGLQKTGAFYADSGFSSQNIFIASIPAITPSLTPTNTPTLSIINTPTTTPNLGHIVINEVFESASNSAEWVELYNPTNNPVDISGWKIEDNTSIDTIPTVSSIPAHGYAVIISNTSTVIGIPPTAITIQLSSIIGNGLSASGDALYLYVSTSSASIDKVSYGSNHDVFTGIATQTNPVKTLARNPNGKDTDTAGDWITNSTPSIGIANP